MGETGGEEAHQLAVAEMPSHNHGITDPTHRHSAVVETGDDTGGSLGDGGAGGAYYYRTTYAATGIAIKNSGSNQPHENMPPFLAMTYIIKY